MCSGLFDTPTVDTSSAVSTETEETSSSDSALESKRQALAAQTDYSSTVLTSGQGDTSQAQVKTPGTVPTSTGSTVLAKSTGTKKKLGQ